VSPGGSDFWALVSQVCGPQYSVCVGFLALVIRFDWGEYDPSDVSE